MEKNKTALVGEPPIVALFVDVDIRLLDFFIGDEIYLKDHEKVEKVR